MSNVLIIDDEKSIRITLSEFIKNESFNADTASNAQIAQQMIQDNNYDVIVTDIIMPNITGIELLEKIRQISNTVQVIIMTGEPTIDTAIKALHNGANAYLKKPVTKLDFIKTVKRAAEIKKIYDEKAYLERENQKYQKHLETLVEQKTQELQDTLHSIISLLSTVIEIRDPYTAGHQRRVGNLSAAIAKKMDLSHRTINLVRIIGYLHDIGKLIVPTELLAKQGILSISEVEELQNHPFYGYEILNKVDLPPIIAEAVYQHHERYDGSGYPRGLRENEITLEAQIIIVADVFESILSHRPYRPALGLQAALQEITKNSGKLYDAKVVTACLQLFNEDQYEIDDATYKISLPFRIAPNWYPY